MLGESRVRARTQSPGAPDEEGSFPVPGSWRWRGLAGVQCRWRVMALSRGLGYIPPLGGGRHDPLSWG